MSPKVQKVHISFFRPATRGTTPDTVPSKTYSTWRAVLFFCFLFFCCSVWFTGLQLKQFARHKCYDKTLWMYSSHFFLFEQYQTQGTLVGLLHLEKPLLFGIVPESQNQPIPLRRQSVMGVAAQRKCACVDPRTSPHLSACTVQQLQLPLCKLVSTVFRNWWSGKSLKKGHFLKKFQNILLLRPNKPKINDWFQGTPMDGRRSMAYCTMILSLKF